MTAFSQVYSVRSNARRAARAHGFDPASVTACKGGFHFPLPDKSTKPAKRATVDTSKALQSERQQRKYRAQRKAAKAEAAAALAPEPMPAAAPKSAKPAKREAPRTMGSGGDKAAAVFAMMLQPKGAAISDICKATGWLPHTARARLSAIREAHKATHTFDRVRLLGETFYYARPQTEEAA